MSEKGRWVKAELFFFLVGVFVHLLGFGVYTCLYHLYVWLGLSHTSAILFILAGVWAGRVMVDFRGAYDR